MKQKMKGIIDFHMNIYLLSFVLLSFFVAMVVDFVFILIVLPKVE